MFLQFLRFYELLGIWVVAWLYGFPSLITTARSLDYISYFQKLSENFIREFKDKGNLGQ